MHEYSVVSELVSSLLENLAGIDGRIVSVRLKKGELRILSDVALEHAFEILRSGTRLEEARLQIETVPASVRCEGCGFSGPAAHLDEEGLHVSIPILACPHCGGEVAVTSGRELLVDSVRVASPEEPSELGWPDEEGGCRPSGDA